MESLLETLFTLPEEVMNDWTAVAQSEGSTDPCGSVNVSDLKALFTKACVDSGFGPSFYAPGLNVFFRGDVTTLTSKKLLVRAYRSESTGRIVLVPIDYATANPCKSFSELLSKVQIKGKVDSSESTPSLE